MKYLTRFINAYLILTLLVLYKSVFAEPETSGAGWHESSIRQDGLTRHFRYYLPESHENNSDLVLLLHGGTQSMHEIFLDSAGGPQEWQALAEREGFLLLVPNGINVTTGETNGDHQNWNDCRIAVEGNNSASTADDVGFIRELIKWARNHFAINDNRVYATGSSNGGMMSLRLITELSHKIAAAAVFIANQPVETDCTSPANPVPLLMMSGTEDPLMKWQGGQILGEGPVMMSAPKTLDFWLSVNHADKKQAFTMQLTDIDPYDYSVIIKSIYPAKPGGQPLWFYEIRGAGHTMPSRLHDIPLLAGYLVGSQNKDLEGSHVAWNFLRQFSKN